YTTRIRNSLPQVFELGDRTVRTPAIDFHPLGSGGLGNPYKAQLELLGPDPGPSNPIYVYDISSVVQGNPTWENPAQPTLTQGGHFLNVSVANVGETVESKFFFDTGASVTVLSEAMADSLGFDVVLDEPAFTISIVGSGGILHDVPGFFVDSLTIGPIIG